MRKQVDQANGEDSERMSQEVSDLNQVLKQKNNAQQKIQSQLQPIHENQLDNKWKDQMDRNFEPVPNETIENSDFKAKIFDHQGLQNDREHIMKIDNDVMNEQFEIPSQLEQIYEYFVISKDKQSHFSSEQVSEIKLDTNIKNNPFGDKQRAVIVALAKQNFD